MVPRRHGVVGAALEDEQPLHVRSRRRRDLHPAGPGADDAHPLAGVLDGLLRPRRGLEPLPLERLESVEVGTEPLRQLTGAHHDESSLQPVASLRLDPPASVGLIERGRADAGPQADVLAQVEPTGDMVDVGEDLRLRCIPLRPGPLLVEFRREAIRVVDAFDVAASARVAVEVPDPADLRIRLEQHHAHAHLVAQLAEHRQTGEAGADHYDVEGLRTLEIVRGVRTHTRPRYRPISW